MNVALFAKQAQERVLEMPILLSQTTARVTVCTIRITVSETLNSGVRQGKI